MSLSPAQRGSFYHELGKLFEAGFPLLQAVETMLSGRTSSGVHRVLNRLRSSALAGLTLTESMAAPGMPFEQMEISLLKACEHSGQIPRGCQWLANYYARLAQTRKIIWKRAAYPLFLLHFGVIILALPKIFQDGQKFSILKDILLPLGIFYALGIVIWITATTIGNMAAHSAAIDRILGRLPLIGSIRRSLALTRFCSGYLMQLDAGVNVMDSLVSAASASHSSRLRKATEEALPGIRAGGQVALNLTDTNAFPAKLTRALLIGEQTGTMDQELRRAAEEYERDAVGRIDTLSEWIPRAIYLAIVLYLGWSILNTFKESLGGLEKMMNDN